jgi:SPP1 gp7 family putative phage head morphogenesis protein
MIWCSLVPLHDSVFEPFLATTPKPSILETMDVLEQSALANLTAELTTTIDRTIAQSDALTAKGDIQTILTLNQGLGVALQRPILQLWEQGWLTGSEHGITEMQSAVPNQLKPETFNLGTDIKRAIAHLFQLVPVTFRNLGAERAIQKRVLKLAGNFAKDTLDTVKADLLASVLPQKDTGNPISRPELLERLQGTLKVSVVRAQMIARTETSTSYAQGRLSSFEQSDLVTHLLFMAIGDHRTTKICKSRSGMVVPKGDRVAVRAHTPSLHVNCRSTWSNLMPAINPRHRKIVEDASRLYSNRQLAPLPKGWRTN